MRESAFFSGNIEKAAAFQGARVVAVGIPEGRCAWCGRSPEGVTKIREHVRELAAGFVLIGGLALSAWLIDGTPDEGLRHLAVGACIMAVLGWTLAAGLLADR